MRRGRDPSRTPSTRRPRPVWDNPRGQLPGLKTTKTHKQQIKTQLTQNQNNIKRYTFRKSPSRSVLLRDVITNTTHRCPSSLVTLHPFFFLLQCRTSIRHSRRFSKCSISWNFISSIPSNIISSFVWAFDSSSVCKCSTCGIAELQERCLMLL